MKGHAQDIGIGRGVRRQFQNAGQPLAVPAGKGHPPDYIPNGGIAGSAAQGNDNHLVLGRSGGERTNNRKKNTGVDNVLHDTPCILMNHDYSIA